MAPSPAQLSIDTLYTGTPNLTDLLADLTPLQLSIDALNTTTPNLAHLLAAVPPSQLSIDALNTSIPNLADLTPQIEYRCLEYHYTKLGRSTGTDLWKTITPSKFHI